MAIEYNGTTFSGANSSQNVNFNGTNMCTVLINRVPVFSRGRWARNTDWDDDNFHTCVYRIDSDGEIYVCWWTYPSATHYLCHPHYCMASDDKLRMAYKQYVHAYGSDTCNDQPIIRIQGTGGDCSGCIFCCTLNTSQWNPQKTCVFKDICANPSPTCSCLCYYEACCSGTFSFYWPGDNDVGRCWYYGRGTYGAFTNAVAEYCVDDICFSSIIACNGVLTNCFIGASYTIICA